MKLSKCLWVLFPILFLNITSCSTYIQFATQKSAEPRYNGIHKVGINNVLLKDRKSMNLRDNLGKWTVSNKSFNDQKLEALVRKSLVTNLRRFSDYQVFDLHDIRKFQNAFQRLRPMSGERIGELDLMINVEIAYYATTQTGTSQEVMTFYQKKSEKIGEKWVTTRDTSNQSVVSVPYSQSTADVVCYVEVIKIQNGEAKVLKSFNTILSYDASPLNTQESMVNELGVVITSGILKNVSKYSALTKREIDKGSEGEIVELMEKADLEAATKKLEMSISKEKKAADLYNLGICYEALGDPGIALQMYRDAYKLDQNKELYIKAIGEIE